MQNTELKLGDRVIVSAAVTGYGEDMHGVVSDVAVFAKTLFVTVTFDKYLPDGTNGRTITNIGMISPEKEVSDKHFPEAHIPENQQIREVCETLPELEAFLVIGRRPKGDETTYFASMTFDSPVDLANAILNLIVVAPQLANPISIALDKFRRLTTPEE